MSFDARLGPASPVTFDLDMSSYGNGRRAPNVSQYLANLNTISTPQDMAAANEFALGDDNLDFLSTTEFFDFDNFDPHVAEFQAQASAGPHVHKPTHTPNMNPAQYQFGEFQTYPANVTTSAGSIPTSPANAIPGQPFHMPAHFVPGPSPDVGDQRKASIAGLSTTADFEDGARMAAEEDKRRRNTAASARFRVKKKQREQALEKQAKDMADKVQLLEGKVQQLEMENKWLKELITEKSEGKVVSLTGSPTSKLSDPSIAVEKTAAERSTDAKRNNGVGTN